MKVKILLSFIFCLLSSILNGQSKYFQISDGSIIDSFTNEKRKAKLMQIAMNSSSQKETIITLVEKLKELKRSKDSLIFSSELKIQFDLDSRKMAEKKSFELKEIIGKEFPLKSLKTLNNKNLSLKDLKGKPTLINFWYTRCKPCIEEMPVLNRIKSALKDSVNFVSITYESSEKVKGFLEKHRFDFIQVTNAQRFIDEIGMTAFPVNIILDKNGIVKSVEGGIAYQVDINNLKKMKMGDGKDIKSQLRALL